MSLLEGIRAKKQADLNDKFIEAMRAANANEVGKLLTKGANPNTLISVTSKDFPVCSEEFMVTPLIYALRHMELWPKSYEPIVHHLIYHRCDLNQYSPVQEHMEERLRHPFFTIAFGLYKINEENAVCEYSSRLFEQLLTIGLDSSVKTLDGNNIFHVSLQSANTPRATWLLDNPQVSAIYKHGRINDKNNKQETPLGVYIKASTPFDDSEEILQFIRHMVDHGADPSQEALGFDMVEYLSKMGHSSIARDLFAMAIVSQLPQGDNPKRKVKL